MRAAWEAWKERNASWWDTVGGCLAVVVVVVTLPFLLAWDLVRMRRMQP